MAVEQVWDTTATDSMSEELAYFSGLKFCRVPGYHAAVGYTYSLG